MFKTASDDLFDGAGVVIFLGAELKFALLRAVRDAVDKDYHACNDISSLFM